MDKLAALNEILQLDPANAFARYGLAMEYVKSGELRQAVTEFQTLISNDSNYSAAYFHGAQAFEKLGLIDEARALYEKGVEATRRTGDAHTRAEIETALSLLPI